MAESAQRRARQHHPFGDILLRGRLGLPRLPRQLHARRRARLARGRRLPHRQRHLGDQAAQAPEVELTALSSLAPARFGYIAGHVFYSHIEVARRDGRGQARNRGVARGCVIPMKSWAWIARRTQATSKALTAVLQKSCTRTPTRTTPKRPRVSRS